MAHISSLEIHVPERFFEVNNLLSASMYFWINLLVLLVNPNETRALKFRNPIQFKNVF